LFSTLVITCGRKRVDLDFGLISKQEGCQKWSVIW
jgi:hypothetical protein